MKDKLNGCASFHNNNNGCVAGGGGGGGIPGSEDDSLTCYANGSATRDIGLECKSSVLHSSAKTPYHNDDSALRHRTHNDSSPRSNEAAPLFGAQQENLVESDELAGDEHHHGESVPTRIQVLKDPANLCTFCGVLFAVLALASMWKGRYYYGMFFNVIANVADIIDGPIARSTPRRHPAFSKIGSKLDTYSDLVSHYVVPASLLMHMGDLNPVSIILAVLYISTGILRQSLFEVTGRCDNGQCVFGMTSDYMVGFYCVTMHLYPILGPSNFLYVLAVCVVVMMYCSLTFSLRSRRYAGFGLLTVTLYNVFLCLTCGFLALYEDDSESAALVATYTVLPLVLLAYPCYFRFVEINR